MELNIAQDRPLELGMVLYPGFTMLDLVGPQTVLSMHSNSHFISHNMDLVPSDSGGSLAPTTTFADAPKQFDILFIPGGLGTGDAMRSDELMDFVRTRGETAAYITSVCTGSLVLAAAGLLQGYRAATHWAFYDALAMFEAVTPVHERVVVDRNRLTGGGVTAGVDFGLVLLSEIRGEDVARMTQLVIEYNPAPPFNSGHPSVAGPELTNMVKSVPMLADGVADVVKQAQTANRALMAAA